MIIRGPACSEEEASEIDKSCADGNVQLYRKGMRRHTAVLPVMRLHGPTIRVMLPEGVKTSKHHSLGHGHNYH